MRKLLALSAAALVAASGCGLGETTVNGSLLLIGPCTPAGGSGGYKDIRAGADVEITDASGTVVAVGELGRSEPPDGGCSYPFTVEGVPDGHDFYQVKIGNDRRGAMTVPADEIDEPIDLVLGP